MTDLKTSLLNFRINTKNFHSPLPKYSLVRFPLKFKSEVGFATFMYLLSAWVLDEVEVEMYSATWERPEILNEQVALSRWKAHEDLSFCEDARLVFPTQVQVHIQILPGVMRFPSCLMPPSPDGIWCRERGYHWYLFFSHKDASKQRFFSKLDRYSTVSWIEYIWIIFILLAKSQC